MMAEKLVAVHDEALKSEIVRLRAENAALLSEQDSLNYHEQKLCAEIGQLKSLLGRAADALEKWAGGKAGEDCDCPYCALVTELRKAAG